MTQSCPWSPFLHRSCYPISSRARQTVARQRTNQPVVASATYHETTRSKHEHVLHMGLFKRLNFKINRYHPSSARKIVSPPHWLRCWAFSDLLGCAFYRNGPRVPHHTHTASVLPPHPAQRQEDGGRLGTASRQGHGQTLKLSQPDVRRSVPASPYYWMVDYRPVFITVLREKMNAVRRQALVSESRIGDPSQDPLEGTERKLGTPSRKCPDQSRRHGDGDGNGG